MYSPKIRRIKPRSALRDRIEKEVVCLIHDKSYRITSKYHVCGVVAYTVFGKLIYKQ